MGNSVECPKGQVFLFYSILDANGFINVYFVKGLNLLKSAIDFYSSAQMFRLR